MYTNTYEEDNGTNTKSKKNKLLTTFYSFTVISVHIFYPISGESGNFIYFVIILISLFVGNFGVSNIVTTVTQIVVFK